MDLELKNISVYSKDLYWILKAVAQLEKEFESEKDDAALVCRAQTILFRAVERGCHGMGRS